MARFVFGYEGTIAAYMAALDKKLGGRRPGRLLDGSGIRPAMPSV